MQKFQLLLCFWAFSMPVLFSQSYTFSYFQEPYAPLQGDSIIAEEDAWGNAPWVLPIGFPLSFMGENAETIQIFEGFLFFNENTDSSNTFIAYGASLSNLGASPVSIQRSGNTGNRILKIQVKNAGFFIGNSQNYVNFQIWIYENDKSLEVHFGPRNINSYVWEEGWNGPIIGTGNSGSGFLFYAGDSPTAPNTYQYGNPDTLIHSLTGPPPANLVYRFTPTVSKTLSPRTHQIDLSVGPIPCNDHLQLSGNELAQIKHFNVFDAAGRCVLNGILSSPELDVRTLLPGSYFLELQGDQQQTAIIKFSKTR